MPTDLPNERPVRPSGSLELDPTSGESLAIDETARLIASSKVEATAVFDRAGERLGTVHTVMLDKISGQIAYVVMASGGVLGIGESYRPLPWKALVYSSELQGYVLDDLSPAPAVPESAAGEPAPVPETP